MNEYLSFKLGDQKKAFPLALVGEIIEITTLEWVPNMLTSFKGIINYRGVVLPVIDLAELLNIEMDYNHTSRIIILKHQSNWIGVLVTQILGMDFMDNETQVIELNMILSHRFIDLSRSDLKYLERG